MSDFELFKRERTVDGETFSPVALQKGILGKKSEVIMHRFRS